MTVCTQNYVKGAAWAGDYARIVAGYAEGGEELYDHTDDPMEHTNLLALPDAARHAERVAYFNDIIDRYHPRHP